MLLLFKFLSSKRADIYCLAFEEDSFLLMKVFEIAAIIDVN